MNLEKKQDRYIYSLKAWLLFDCLMPAIMIIGFWPICQYFTTIPFPFEKAFYSADLMPIGSLLMLGVAREIECEQKSGRISSVLDNFKLIGVFLPFIILMVYSLLKFKSISYTFPTVSQEEIDPVIQFSAYLSFAIIFFSGCFCFLAKYKIIDSLSEQGDS